MGFFKDFKRDFAQAVNELMPDPNEIGAEYDDEDMVNTFDEGDLMDIAPEDLLEDLDDIKIDRDDFDLRNLDDIKLRPEMDYEEEKTKKEENIFDTIPDAEIISDQLESQLNAFDESFDMQEIVPEMLQGEKVSKKQKDVEAESLDETIPEGADDELKALDALDEENMMENTAEAFAIEPDQPEKPSENKLMDADINQAVEDVLAKNSEELDNKNEDTHELVAADELKSAGKTTTSKDDIFTSEISYITKTTTITGNLESDGDIDIIGSLVGDVHCAGKLIVGGSVLGNVDAGELYANAAKIEGTLNVEHSAKIGVGSIIVGNVFAGSAVIAGAVKGDIDVQGPVIVDSTAVVMGNIKSKSVQINNGAVIEGLCSQCYSEIDVKSFFE